jgi:hypothetical protein
MVDQMPHFAATLGGNPTLALGHALIAAFEVGVEYERARREREA